MNLLSAALLGVVQGLTEFLPVSSTAHLLIVSRLVGFNDPGGVFTVTIQFGSVLALMWVYRAKLFAVVSGLGSDSAGRRFAVMLVIAFVPAAVAGGLFGSTVKRVLYASVGTPDEVQRRALSVIGGAFLVGGIVMLVVERLRPVPVVHQADRTPVWRAFVIGVCQALALVPGVSRSGATIVGGLLVGLDRPAAAEFSFFLAMPTLAAACLHDVWDVRHQLAPERALEIAVGLVMAFAASLLVVKPFLRFVARAGFAPFAWYRIAAGLAILAAVSVGLF